APGPGAARPSRRRGPGALRCPGARAHHWVVRGRVAPRVRARDQGVLRPAVRPRPARAHDVARRAASAAALRAGRATRDHAAGADAGRRVPGTAAPRRTLVTRRSEEHTSELQSRSDIVCRLLLE